MSEKIKTIETPEVAIAETDIQTMVRDLIARKADLIARVESKGKIQSTVTDVVGKEGFSVTRRDSVHLEALHSVRTDDMALDPNREFDTFSAVADLPGIARARVLITDGRVNIADYRDDNDRSQSSLGEPTADGLRKAADLIEIVAAELVE